MLTQQEYLEGLDKQKEQVIQDNNRLPTLQEDLALCLREQKALKRRIEDLNRRIYAAKLVSEVVNGFPIQVERIEDPTWMHPNKVSAFCGPDALYQPYGNRTVRYWLSEPGKGWLMEFCIWGAGVSNNPGGSFTEKEVYIKAANWIATGKK